MQPDQIAVDQNRAYDFSITAFDSSFGDEQVTLELIKGYLPVGATTELLSCWLKKIKK